MAARFPRKYSTKYNQCSDTVVGSLVPKKKKNRGHVIFRLNNVIFGQKTTWKDLPQNGPMNKGHYAILLPELSILKFNNRDSDTQNHSMMRADHEQKKPDRITCGPVNSHSQWHEGPPASAVGDMVANTKDCLWTRWREGLSLKAMKRKIFLWSLWS